MNMSIQTPLESFAAAMKVKRRPERLPLSHAQQRLWFIDRLEGASTEYNMPGSLRLRGELDVEALEKAINTIVERHESLRTHFAEVEGEPVQVIEKERRIVVTVGDLSGREGGLRRGRVPEEMGLPLDRPRPALQTFAGEACRMVLPAEQVAGLKRLSQENQATLYMTLMTAFAVLLWRYSGQEDIVVGSPIANRQEARLEE